MRRALLLPVTVLTMVALVSTTAGCRPGIGKRRGKGVSTGQNRNDRDNDQTNPTNPAAMPTRQPRLRCKNLDDARISPAGGLDIGPLQLSDGRWSGSANQTVELRGPCVTGELNGDLAGELVSVVTVNGGGSGTFFTVVVWRDVNGEPVTVTGVTVGDRTPVLEMRIEARKLTVVYLTRTDDAPRAVTNLRRTATYRLDGSRLVEVGHTDRPA